MWKAAVSQRALDMYSRGSVCQCCSFLSRSNIPFCRQTTFCVSSQQLADTVCPFVASVKGAAGNIRAQDLCGLRFSIFLGAYLLLLLLNC